MKNLSKKIRKWYLENKVSAISTIIGSTSLLLAFTSTYKAIDNNEINKLRKNHYVTEYINADVQLKELKDELKFNKGYYIVNTNIKKHAKNIEDSLENKLDELEKDNNIVQKYKEKILPSKKYIGSNKNGFYHYHKRSRKSENHKYLALILYTISGLSYFAKIMEKTLGDTN